MLPDNFSLVFHLVLHRVLFLIAENATARLNSIVDLKGAANKYSWLTRCERKINHIIWNTCRETSSLSYWILTQRAIKTHDVICIYNTYYHMSFDRALYKETLLLQKQYQFGGIINTLHSNINFVIPLWFPTRYSFISVSDIETLCSVCDLRCQIESSFFFYLRNLQLGDCRICDRYEIFKKDETLSSFLYLQV